ncbi:MAG: cysteine desulfurase family protein [Minisyncoccales bacterium]
MKKIYLDYAATTPVDPRVAQALRPYLSQKFGNPMSLHSWGQEAKEILEDCRQKIADFIGAKTDEVIFTSSATESNNLALKGIAWANRFRGNHLVISSIEHPCIVESANWLAKQGFKITKLPVDHFGLVLPKAVKKVLTKKTILVSIIHASNEIGTIQPIAEIGKIIQQFNQQNRQNRVYFHTDAAQSFGKIPINVDQMNLDLLTASSHKIYGPKGAALLYVRRGTNLESLLHGGGQEFGLRSSTVNLPAIVGFTTACQLYQKERKRENVRLVRLRNKLIREILKRIPESHLNGHPTKRLPNNVNFWFKGVEGESLVIQLDLKGVAVSTGSACSSIKLEPSHILLALGLKPEQAHGSLRISLGRWTTEKEINYVIKVLSPIIEKLRKISGF